MKQKQLYVGLFTNGKEISYTGYERLPIRFVMKKAKMVNKNEIVFPICKSPTTISGVSIIDKEGNVLYEGKVGTIYAHAGDQLIFYKGDIRIEIENYDSTE